ncbi:MAG TPA: hypothetical protein VL098_01180 [Flavipsychrobacter sp.]|nr:hypothetical protein [Flavipsychrobacter sp.]
MKKQHLLFLCLATLSLAYSCKKDDTISSNGTSSTKEPIDNKTTGFFTSVYYQVDGSATNQSVVSGTQNAFAMFYRSRKDTVAIPATKVWINGIETSVMPYGNLSQIHFQSTSTGAMLDMNGDAIWKIYDTTYSEIPDFTFNHRLPFPTVLGTIDDSLSKSKPSALDIEIAGADSVTVYIDGNVLNNAPGVLVKQFVPNHNNLKFTVDEMKNLFPSDVSGTKNGVEIIAHTTTTQQFEGRYYSFKKITIYRGAVWVTK